MSHPKKTVEIDSDDSPAVGYSLLRFSTPEQAKGDSFRRQTEGAKEWCKRNNIRLDTSLWLFDPAVSGFTGKQRENPDKHALAAFLKLVEKRKVLKGSYLIIENLDRLTREDERAALRLWMDILDQGINIVQLQPETVFRHEKDKSDMFDIMRAIMELARGHGESARKSERNGAAWQAKLDTARNSGEILTARLPAWLERKGGELVHKAGKPVLRGGKAVLIPERAAVVKRIFRMAANGYGIASIVKRLTQEGVPPFGELVLRPGKKRSAYSGVWVRAYIALILKDRRALGECQPKGTGRKPAGDPIKLFPAVVTEEEFFAARAGALERKKKPGRIGEHVNVFAGLLRNARDGDTFFVAKKAASKGGGRLLINTAGSEARAKHESFPADTFEDAVLSRLAEINPHEILNGDQGPDESLSLAGQFNDLNGRIADLEAELISGASASLSRVVKQLEKQRDDIATKLADARFKAAHPLSESWGETQSLVKILANATDPADARLRLRSALRRIIDSIWLLIVPRGYDRLAAVQIRFSNGKHRDYLILHRPPKANGKASRPRSSRCLSLADVTKLGDIDFRRPANAKSLEALLAAIDAKRVEAWLHEVI